MLMERFKPLESERFRKDRKRAKELGLDFSSLKWTIEQLALDVPLPPIQGDRQLQGIIKRFRECRIGESVDWLLVYEKRAIGMILYLAGIRKSQR